MFINKTKDGRNNVCGKNISKYRMKVKISQRELADRLQRIGLDVDKNAIQRMESGQRFITDLELLYLCRALNVTMEQLFEDTEEQLLF